jgi:hypothetical protein
MQAIRIGSIFVFCWAALSPAEGRVFSTEQQYVAQFGANVNKGAPVAPPYKFALYRHKKFSMIVLFLNQVSEGELIVRTNGSGRLTDSDVNGILAANQGTSVWKKEKIDTNTDPNAPQVSLWTRKDGKLYALYVSSGPTPCVLVGTKRGGDYLMKQKESLAAAVKG